MSKRSGEPGSAGGIYGRRDWLKYVIKANEQQLAGAPLSPNQSLRLSRLIERQKAELADLNMQIKARKPPTKDQLRIERARAEGLLP